jgi:hypothetical protein
MFRAQKRQIMIGNGIRVHYHTEPVESCDQAVSLAAYFQRHGQLAYKESDGEVIVPLECPTEDIAADRTRQVHMLRSTWELFWEHTDQGVLALPIYLMD